MKNKLPGGSLFFSALWQFLSNTDKEGCHSAWFATTVTTHEQHLLCSEMALGVCALLFFHIYLIMSMLI